MRWAFRALLVAVCAIVLYILAWSYENWFFLVLVKRMITLAPRSSQGKNAKIVELIAQQPPTSVSPIVLAVAPKQGTTWSGHICFQVRARGAPVPERNLMLDMPYADELPMYREKLTEWRNISGSLEPPFWQLSKVEPHILRTHLEMKDLKELGMFPKYRVITVFRDPIDAVVSAWRFIPQIFSVPYELINPNLLARVMLWTRYDNALHNMVDYWNIQDDPSVLILFFDDMKDDLSGTIRRIAKFMDVSPPLTEGELQKVESQSTNAAMSGVIRFDCSYEVETVANLLGLSPDQATSGTQDMLVRPGGGKKDGTHVLSEDIQREMHARWNAIVAKQTGMQNFTHYRDTLRAKRR